MRNKHFIVYGMFLWLICIDTYAATLLLAKARQEKNTTKIDFLFTSPVQYKTFSLDNPRRLVLDFKNTHYRYKIGIIPVSSPILKKIRTGYPYPGTFRVVMEVKQKVSEHIAVLSQNPYKLRISLLAKENRSSRKLAAQDGLRKKAAQRIGAKIALPLTLKNSVKNNIQVVSRKIKTKEIIESVKEKNIITHKHAGLTTIVIDAGHGGKDPGARGPYFTKEKDVVFEIAKKIKKIIDKEPGMRAVLTRNADVYVSLRKRLDIARENNADLFISIHADAFKQSDLSGVSVYALSQSGATNEAAHWLAEKENYSELGGIHLNHLDDKDGLVRETLIDLSQTATIGASVHVGERVLKALDKVTALHDSRVEQARFVVLKSPDIPSILIETGFISNPKEERKLLSGVYQEKLSQAVFNGIKQYFIDYTQVT